MITHIFNHLPLLSEIKDSGIVWGRFSQRGSGVSMADMSVMVGASALLIVVILYSYWRARRQKLEFLRNSSTHLFGELSRAHRLDRAHRRLVKKLAVVHGVENSPAMFVEPDYFDSTKLPEKMKPAAPQLRLLRHELFE